MAMSEAQLAPHPDRLLPADPAIRPIAQPVAEHLLDEDEDEAAETAVDLVEGRRREDVQAVSGSTGA